MVRCGVLCVVRGVRHRIICNPRHIEKLLNVQQPKHSSKLDEESKI